MSREGIFIQLGNYSRPFFPGEEIFGEIHLSFLSPQEYKYLSVKIEGKVEVNWTKTISKRRQRRKVTKLIHYRDVERVLNRKMKLMEAESGSTLFLSPGNSTFPFTLPLPFDLPSSFKSGDGLGKVSYTISARLKKPWFAFDHFTTFPFQVNGNKLPRRQNQISSSFEAEYLLRKTFTQTSCKLLFPKRAFVPGETIPFLVQFTDEKGSKSAKISAVLVQIVSYKIRRGKQSQRLEFQLGKVFEVMKENEMESGIKIPLDAVPSALGGVSKIISVRYAAKVTMSLGPFYISRATAKVPILIIGAANSLDA